MLEIQPLSHHYWLQLCNRWTLTLPKNIYIGGRRPQSIIPPTNSDTYKLGTSEGRERIKPKEGWMPSNQLE